MGRPGILAVVAKALDDTEQLVAQLEAEVAEQQAQVDARLARENAQLDALAAQQTECAERYQRAELAWGDVAPRRDELVLQRDAFRVSAPAVNPIWPVIWAAVAVGLTAAATIPLVRLPRGAPFWMTVVLAVGAVWLGWVVSDRLTRGPK